MGLLDTRNSIVENLEKGISRQEIFRQHVDRQPEDAAKLAFAIASVPQRELRKKYRKHNGALFLCLVAIGLLSFIGEMPIDTEQSTLFLFLRVAIPLVFSYFVYHFHGGIYRLIGAWCLFDLVEVILLGKYVSAAGLLRFFAIIFAAILAFFLARKVFYNLKFFGSKRDEQGRYLL